MEFSDGTVRLRALETSDLDQLRSWINDPETTNFLSISWPVSSHEQSEWFQRVQNDGNRRKLAVALTNGRLIGLISFHNMASINRSVDIGITIGDPEWRRQGLALRTLDLATRVLFDHFNYHRVSAHILETNTACLRLFKRAGFEQEGILRESVYWNGRWIGTVLMAKLRGSHQQDEQNPR